MAIHVILEIWKRKWDVNQNGCVRDVIQLYVSSVSLRIRVTMYHQKGCFSSSCFNKCLLFENVK